jgi:hypothetical protein
MAGKLDEISEAIGRLRASVSDIRRCQEHNRTLQERRHADTSAALRDLAQKLDAHAAAVEAITPTVAALALSRSRLATFASIGFAAVILVGLLFQEVVKYLLSAALSHFH